MLDKCNVVCILDAEVEGLRVEVGQTYEVISHSIDKSKWYIISPSGKWVIFDKYCFEHVVTDFAIHKAYGEFRLPILNKELSMFTVISPTGYAQSKNMADVMLGKFETPQRIPCDEVRFRGQERCLCKTQ